MKYFTDRADLELVPLIKKGAIGVLRTDTLYGLVASARDETAVARTYEVRGRDRDKACIVLVGDRQDLFDVPEEPVKSFIDSYWPGAVSVAIPSPSAPEYLRFHDGSVAYRLPDDSELRALLKMTGPLIAPSANIQNEPPARSIQDAEAYFGRRIDFYVDSGPVRNTTPSQLWTIDNGEMRRIR